jgi:hypothetical protein
MATKTKDPRQLSIQTLWLSELVMSRLKSIAAGSNSTVSEVAEQILFEVLNEYD